MPMFVAFPALLPFFVSCDMADLFAAFAATQTRTDWADCSSEEDARFKADVLKFGDGVWPSDVQEACACAIIQMNLK